MIYWMLSQLEKSPAAAFYQKDLISRFPETFEKSQRDGLIRRLPISLSKPMSLYSHGLKRSYVVIERDDGILEAFDPQDPEAEPIEISVADMAQWTLDLPRLRLKYQEVNGLKGQPEDLDDGLHFLGESGDEDNRIAFVLGLVHDLPSARLALSALPGLLPGYERIGVACPMFTPPPTEVNRLDQLGIVVFPLPKDDPFHLPTAKEVCLLNRRPVQDKEFDHGPNYEWVKWRGKHYELVNRRAVVMGMLHDAHEQRKPGLHWHDIKRRLIEIHEPAERMRDVFKGSPLWETLIVPVSKSMYRLSLSR